MVTIIVQVDTFFQTVSIPNAYEDPRFDPSVDEGTGFRHRTILCMPIKNSSGQIIGVIQLINKFDDLSFTKNDENFVEAFAIFCGMGIHNTHMSVCEIEFIEFIVEFIIESSAFFYFSINLNLTYTILLSQVREGCDSDGQTKRYFGSTELPRVGVFGGCSKAEG